MARSRAKSSIKGAQRQVQGARPPGIEKRSLADARGKYADIEPRQPFPSPPTSNALSREAQQHLASPLNPEATKASQQPQESDINRRPERKRNRSQEQTRDEPAEKQARSSSPGCAKTGDIDRGEDRWIEHWIKAIPWPEWSFDKGFEMSQQQLAKKRSSSSMSYSHGVKEGRYPVAHTSSYEQEILKPAGIILDHQLGDAAVGEDAKELCKTLLDTIYEPPLNSLFEGDLFFKVINGIRNEGEGRVVRDLQADLVPSAEILSFRGLSEVNYLKETIKVLWNNVASVAGPTPCPDFTVGLLPSAFTESERETLLHRFNSSNASSKFATELYFPFFTCESKCGANGLNESDRQNARSAATAIKAIYELYRRTDKTPHESASATDKLHRRIFFFSISHDHKFVQIFGHYPFIKEDKIYFYRHLIKQFHLTAEDGKDRWTSYNFVRKLYDHFAPIHLKRIRDAIPDLPEPSSESLMSLASTADGQFEEPISQATASAPASQDPANFKEPRPPPKAKSQKENDAYKTENRELSEAMKMLRQQLEQQRQESERQRQESERQRQEMKEQMELQREMISLLKEQRR